MTRPVTAALLAPLHTGLHPARQLPALETVLPGLAIRWQYFPPDRARRSLAVENTALEGIAAQVEANPRLLGPEHQRAASRAGAETLSRPEEDSPSCGPESSSVKNATTKPSVVSMLVEHPARLLLVGPGLAPLKDRLLGLGFEVEGAPTVSRALSLAQTWFPLLFVLSSELGPDACRRLRQDESLVHVPTIFYSPRPLPEEALIQGLEAGANDFVVEPCSSALLTARIGAQLTIYRSHIVLRDRMVRDELTGVFSRRYLFESMRQHVSRFSRPGPPVLACLMLDVDHFKAVNDRLGHLEGDRILRDVAELIYSMTRKGDVVARFGGEEFVVILPSTSPNGAAQVAEKLRRAVERDCRQEKVTVSIGVSWFQSRPSDDWGHSPGDEEVINWLLARADEALYRAKSAGRNRVSLQSEFLGEERRNFPRLGLTVGVSLGSPTGQVLHRIAEVSAGGMAIPDVDLRVGDSLEVTMGFDPPVRAVGHVVWSRVGEGCGLVFDGFGEGGREHLIRLLGHRTRIRRRKK